MSEKRKLINRTDLILIGMILLVALLVYVFYNRKQSEPGATCEISIDGDVVKTVDLAVDEVFALEQLPHVHFQVKEHSIAFIESDCPDKVCIHSGFLKNNGQMAACLPNHVSIMVLSKQEASPDDIDMIAN